VQLIDVADASAEVGATSARLAKIARIADLLRGAGADDDPKLVTVVVSWLSGELPQRQIGVGWAALRPGAAPAHCHRPAMHPSESTSTRRPGKSAIPAAAGAVARRGDG